MPTASAENSSRAESTSAPAPPPTVSAGAPSRVTRPERRLGSRLSGTSIDTPATGSAAGPESRSVTTTTSLPTGTSSRSAIPAPTAVRTKPEAFRSATVTSPSRATAAVTEPSARPGSRRARCSSVPADCTAAEAITVGRNGPGIRARPVCSATTTSSSSPKPDPPTSSPRCRPNQPSPASSLQKSGRVSGAPSRRARASVSEPRWVRKAATVSASATWSSLMAIDIRLLLLVGSGSVLRCVR